MSLPWFKRTAWLAFGLALLTASCSETGNKAPESPLAPPVLHSQNSNTNYTPIRDPLPLTLNLKDLLSTQLIGISGGSISLLGHSITVPKGAVTTPTIFTITVLPTGYTEVSLLALVPNLLSTLNIGEQGFKKPVTLTMTWARSPVPIDPSRVVILWNHDGTVDPMPTTVNATKKTASAQLPHFSKYCMATN
ncbi:MAG TPA: hypothetical protein VM100_05495 [Longimicrobiales bacterium]|nr:hypothetical protein [Longimicrobiales bacterium]